MKNLLMETFLLVIHVVYFQLYLVFAVYLAAQYEPVCGPVNVIGCNCDQQGRNIICCFSNFGLDKTGYIKGVTCFFLVFMVNYQVTYQRTPGKHVQNRRSEMVILIGLKQANFCRQFNRYF
jgi:hypothetical protein